ncbi:MAG: hypothetical protein JRI25_29135, partial [Deltaproteobacteria bacterium]|nr:hypothetical protein [Deltaproteobacteria bacterium]
PDPTIPGTLHESYPGTWYDAARSAPAGMGISWGEEVTDTIEFEIVEAYPGSAYEDLCISGMGVWILEPEGR